ncbi:YgaP family membrane protein [Pontibacter sp. MBLB2868]|uniref:YgaP family membrane protein n=1 Tax=Pontibacter sp. MBLB2868 TaxID=3451555 RepID=UPI003F74EB75
MKKNMGSTDRIIRLIVAAIIAVLYFAGILTGSVSTVLLIVAFIFVATSLVGFCPLYGILGLSTCPRTTKHHD